MKQQKLLIMNTVTLNETNINIFKSAYQDDDNYTLIIESGKPIGLFTSFSNEIFNNGLVECLQKRRYKFRTIGKTIKT